MPGLISRSMPGVARAGRAAMRNAILGPVWAAQLFTGAKSFMDNPLIGSAALNRLGLHEARVRAAHALAASRRNRLRAMLPEPERAAFDRDGCIEKRDFLPAPLFEALLAQARAWRGTVREQRQGGAVTRRIALAPPVLDGIPAAEAVLSHPFWRGAIRYAGSFDAEPLTYLQTILSGVSAGADDPQCTLHQDTFHPTVKAWLFLTDVETADGPFTYVPGSHRPTPARLAWERQTVLGMSEETPRLTRRGSFRATPDDLAAMGLPGPRAFAVPANTLVVADTYGFHARGASSRPSMRVEVFASGRRNPFLPWTGLDPWRVPALGRRRMPLFWWAGDRAQRLGWKPSPWRARPGRSAFDPV